VSAYIAAELRRRIRESFAECCAYCHTAEHLTVVTFEVDHILPTSAGGPTTFENLCFTCPMCNRHKGDRTSVLEPATGKVVALFHPQRDRWSEHFAWSADGSELVGLTPTGRATVAALRMNRPQLVRMRKLWSALDEHPPLADR
jgi:hypothetical protein